MAARNKPERVKVTDPYSGAELTVNADSPQAKAWSESKPAAKASSDKSSK